MSYDAYHVGIDGKRLYLRGEYIVYIRSRWFWIWWDSLWLSGNVRDSIRAVDGLEFA